MTDETELDENEIVALRRSRLAELRALGNAFPNDFRRQHLALQLHEKFGEASKEDLEAAAAQTAVAGRIVLRRMMGKASFLTLQDVSGRIQLYVRQDEVGAEAYEAFKSWDIGDIVGAAGSMMKTNKGELTVNVIEIRMLTKSLRPLPDKHKGLSDTETRYRQRYLDLMVNEETRDLFIKRSQIVDGIRRFLIDHDFMEVETPMMQSIPGGATAAPFTTYYNALDTHMYLRVAPELNLKRLVVGGFERVFEINRNFRNEGMSTKHSPEFTMLEFYWAYADYNDLMDMTEALLRQLAVKILGSTEFTYNNVVLDFGQPFARMSMSEALVEFNDSISADDVSDYDSARKLAEKIGIEVKDSWGLGKLVMELFEELVEDKIEQPIFITEHPTEVSPLARRNDDNPDITDRFELFVMGKEIANGFSELNDAEDQAERFRQQVEAKDAGDDEAMHYDDDYITALEYGLPPTAGEGLGIDRLVMLFTDSASIRDVVLFPHMRPRT
jgi:lysyl-tRNA synthetase class 2